MSNLSIHILPVQICGTSHVQSVCAMSGRLGNIFSLFCGMHLWIKTMIMSLLSSLTVGKVEISLCLFKSTEHKKVSSHSAFVKV